MAFSPASLAAKLDALAPTQESITATSQWVLFYHRHAETIVQAWRSYLDSHASRALTLLYLANDVVQQARAKRRLVFVEQFGSVLPEVVNRVYGDARPDVQHKVRKLVGVWKERRIFSPVIELVPSSVSASAAAGTAGASATGGDRARDRARERDTDVVEGFRKRYHEALASGDKTRLEQVQTLLNTTVAALVELQQDIAKEAGRALQRAEETARKKAELERKVRLAEEERQEQHMLPSYSRDSDSDDGDDEGRGDGNGDDSDSDSDKDTTAEEQEQEQEQQQKKKLRFE
jgi:uncharacterized protein YeaO (DUF488 family)